MKMDNSKKNGQLEKLDRIEIISRIKKKWTKLKKNGQN